MQLLGRLHYRLLAQDVLRRLRNARPAGCPSKGILWSNMFGGYHPQVHNPLSTMWKSKDSLKTTFGFFCFLFVCFFHKLQGKT